MKYIGLYSDPQDIATKANVDEVKDRVATAENDIDALETAVAGKQDTITGGATTITSDNLTANRALVSDGNGKVAVSDVTDVEIGYMDGVTSNVQAQLNAKVPNTRTINNKALSADISLTPDDVGAVPTTRTVNNKALSADITLTADDVGALPDTTIIPVVNNAKLTIQKNGATVGTFTANSSTDATANIVVPTTASDIDAVPTSRTVNGHALSANVAVTKSDVGLANGVNIVVQSTQPTQSTGDFWYELT